MNERIRELAVEAGIISAEYNGFDPTGLTTSQRKFAELIVQECSRIADDWVNNEDNGKNYPSDMIKQHFGVER